LFQISGVSVAGEYLQNAYKMPRLTKRTSRPLFLKVRKSAVEIKRARQENGK